MCLLKRGQFFIDLRAANNQGTKPKYFIAMTSADFDDDWVVCFVINTERHMDKMASIGCNKKRLAYVLEPGQFSFLTEYSSIFLRVRQYTLAELINSNTIKMLDIAPDELCRKIKNCCDKDNIEVKFWKMLNEEYNI